MCCVQVTYYDDIGEAYTWAVELPVAALSLDFLGVPGSVLGSDTAALIEKHGFPEGKRLGAGVVDGRSVWADGESAPNLIAALVAKARPAHSCPVWQLRKLTWYQITCSWPQTTQRPGSRWAFAHTVRTCRRPGQGVGNRVTVGSTGCWAGRGAHLLLRLGNHPAMSGV